MVYEVNLNSLRKIRIFALCINDSWKILVSLIKNKGRSVCICNVRFTTAVFHVSNWSDDKRLMILAGNAEITPSVVCNSSPSTLLLWHIDFSKQHFNPFFPAQRKRTELLEVHCSRLPRILLGSCRSLFTLNNTFLFCPVYKK